MIPLKINLKNFISYGAAQEIDFEPYNLICLSGKNGHGKSALLDALTWVLWGQARKTGGTAKADEGLLRLGQTHMMVSLDFSANNILYRVKREYTVAAQKSQTNLEFGILDSTTGTLRPLTDKTIRATQAKIVQMIGLDYDSFVNTAFLRQGQSNEFSKKSPKERKEILATILGLNHFEEMRRCALDKVKDALNQKEPVQAAITRLKQELDKLPALNQEMEQIQTALGEILRKETELYQVAQEIKLKKDSIASKKAQTEKIIFQKQHLEKIIEEQGRQIVDSVSLWRMTARKQRSLHLNNLDDLPRQQTALQTELQTLHLQGAQKIQLKEMYLTKKEAAQQWVLSMQEQYKQAETQTQLQEQMIGLQIKAAKEKIEERQKRKAILSKEIAQIDIQLTLYNKQEPIPEEFVKNAQASFERKKEYYHTFASQLRTLTTRLDSLQQKKQLITDTQEAQCPLCEQKANKDDLCKKFEKEQQGCSHQIDRLTQVIKNLKHTLTQENSALELLKKKMDDAKRLLAQKSDLENHKVILLTENQQLEEEVTLMSTVILELHDKKMENTKEREKIAAWIQKIPEHETHKHLQKELDLAQRSFETIPYDGAREKTVHEKLASVNLLLTERATFLQEGARQEERKQAIHQKCDYTREIKKQILILAANATELDTYTHQEALITIQEKELMGLQMELTKKKELLIHQKGTIEAYYAAVKQGERELLKAQEALQALLTQEDDYSIIATALSKDGVQALLIEEVLPEIEQEANTLLAKLTDNQAHLSIESLRDLRSGKTKETLDIKISDALGVRPYELFSGGEAFRIDFALRIAISKLLARRSGAALQTLIIDEGFGSQDEEGLAQMMEALYTIQEDFAKILIVSHLASMKEQFPVHFKVSKTAEGSSVQVIEHC